MQHTAVLILIVAAGAAGAAACDQQRGNPSIGVPCADITVPGSVVQQPGIQSTLRNQDGLAVATGVSVPAISQSFVNWLTAEAEH